MIDYSKMSTEELLGIREKLSKEISRYDNLQNSKSVFFA